MLVFYRESKNSEICAVYFRQRMKEYKEWRRKHKDFLIIARQFA